MKWERWERAEQFWEMVTTSSDDEAGRLREALASIRTEEEEGAVKFPPPSAREKMAVLVRAWNEFVRGKILTKRALDLSDIRTLDENGHPVLTQCPVVGGIDQGDRIKAQRRDGILVMTEEEMETKRTAAREARGRQMDASVRRT